MRSSPWLVRWRWRGRRTGGGWGRCPELLSERPVPSASRWCYNLEPRISSVLTGRQCLCAGVWRWCAWDGNSYSKPSHISRAYSLRWRGPGQWYSVKNVLRRLMGSVEVDVSAVWYANDVITYIGVAVWHILYVNGAYLQHISSQGLSETIQRISKKNLH